MNQSVFTQNFHKNTPTVNLIDIVLLLVTNTIERMEIWVNPQKVGEEMNSKKLFTNLINQHQKNFVNLIRSAWSYSPKLALKLYNYLSRNEIVKKELEKLVYDNAKNLTSIPEAVEYLVTEENVKLNIPEFKYLLTWETR
jgi:phosphatidylinositol 4-kinase